MSATNTTERPALREPMVWLMLALPLAALLGGIVTLAIALAHPAQTSDGEPLRLGPVPHDAAVAAHRSR